MGSELPWVWGVAFAAGVAAIAAAVRARGQSNRHRLVWTLVALGCGIRAIGQALSSRTQADSDLFQSFPSLSDICFLGFFLLAGIAMLAYPLADRGTPTLERALDATTTTVALGLASWVLLLDPDRASVPDGLQLAARVVYPLSDVVLVALAIVVFARVRGLLVTLVLLVAGLLALLVSDTLFAYLWLTAESVPTGGLVDLGWLAGFLLIALAAIRAEPDPGVIRPASTATAALTLGWDPAPRSQRMLTWNLLPYAPVAVALGLAIYQSGKEQPLSIGQLWLVAVVVALALVRQYLNVSQNASLTRRLEAREAQLRQKAFHDGMTGLANRALFRDRLVHALELHDRDRRAVSVLFLDLDDFKLINDTMGHARGDELLVRVSERLIGVVRTGDTVARLGGDEFAILLEDSKDPLTVAAKIHDVLNVPFAVDGHNVEVGVSLGVFSLDAKDGLLTADALLSRADTAMYAAKRSGKSRIVAYQDEKHLIEMFRR